MEKFIPYEKLSKKKQRELNARKRKTWGNVNPVTRRTENPKAYNRQKARKWNDDSDFAPFIALEVLAANLKLCCNNCEVLVLTFV